MRAVFKSIVGQKTDNGILLINFSVYGLWPVRTPATAFRI